MWTLPKQFGRGLGSHRAEQSDDEGPDLYVLNEVGSHRTIHALTKNGIHLWRWQPTKPASGTLNLICGNHVGGTIVKQQGTSGFELYDLDDHGTVRWTYAGNGEMDAYALGEKLFLVQASPDHLQVAIVALNADTGSEDLRYQLPASQHTVRNAIDQAGVDTCMPGHHIETSIPILTSLLFINIDGDAYLAFTRRFRTLDAVDCSGGEPLGLKHLRLSRDDSLMLFRISPDGVSISTLVHEEREDAIPAEHASFSVTQPTHAIIPDGVGGTLVSVQVLRGGLFSKQAQNAEEFVYRVTDQGILAYKFRLPPYSGARHDSMVLGGDETAFVTRGSLVVCFDAITGAERWHYDTGVPEIQIVVALADGGVVVGASGQAIIVHKNGARIDRVIPDNE
jgi:outer membrane protein assembly factor BamB